jgi:hypothetical protein
LFGKKARVQDGIYNYVIYDTEASAALAADPASAVLFETGSNSSADWDFTNAYSNASTPWITSQEVAGNTTRLFRIHTLSHGTNQNYEMKIEIQGVRPAGSIPGSNYGSFNVLVRAVDQDSIVGSIFSYDDSDSRPNVLEQFTNVNLDPDSPNFIARVIGDKYRTVDSEGKVSSNGDWKNNSKRIRVEVAKAVELGGAPVNLVPFGFEALSSPLPSAFTAPRAVSYVADQNIGGNYNSKKPWGFDFNESDNINYLRPLPVDAKLTTGNNTAFLLSDYSQPSEANYPSAASPYTGSINLTSTETSEKTRKFVVPFQGGFDGFKPHLQKRTGEYILNTNTQGFDLTSTGDGYTAYRRALSTLENQDVYDINMLVVPGVLQQLHSGVTSKAIEVCEDRADAFYVMDNVSINANITTAINTVESLDTNYAATYHPWVKILDSRINKPVWVPPSVVVPGIIAFSDKVSDPWFAPAGLNRGGITEALEAYETLNVEDRNDLYEKRINPIAQFPNSGLVIWGQKTLQAKPSALDRINVRRLLIAAKKFIASSSKYLVFEQNTAVTRNRFLNIVNPYLESVQQRQGLFAFKVVMDESNNTPDTIDRNQLVGNIYLQPTRTAEFILLDFAVQRTGASFEE